MRPDLAVPLLWSLYGLFFLRVAGQVPVMLAEARGRRLSWLPPPAQWYSGLIPYPALLAFQILFLVLMAAMIAGLGHAGSPAFPGLGPPSPALAKACMAFSVPYSGFMVYRWVFRVLRNPARRWYDTLIPILFHCVLAAFLLVYGSAGLSLARA